MSPETEIAADGMKPSTHRVFAFGLDCEQVACWTESRYPELVTENPAIIDAGDQGLIALRARQAYVRAVAGQKE